MFKVGIFEGLDVYFLGFLVLILMFGFRNVIIVLFIVLLGVNVVGYGSWENFGVNGLFGIVLFIGIIYFFYMFFFYCIFW